MLKRRVPTSAIPDDDGKCCGVVQQYDRNTTYNFFYIPLSFRSVLEVDDDDDDAFPEEEM